MHGVGDVFPHKPKSIQKLYNKYSNQNRTRGILYTNFDGFKNRYETSISEQIDYPHIIEVLDGDDNSLMKEIEAEENRRKKHRKTMWEDINEDTLEMNVQLSVEYGKIKTPRAPVREIRHNGSPVLESPVVNGRIHRVRINSLAILYVLGGLINDKEFIGLDNYEQLTFFRPFRVFIYYQPEMKKILKMLEKRLARKAEKNIESSTNLSAPEPQSNDWVTRTRDAQSQKIEFDEVEESDGDELYEEDSDEEEPDGKLVYGDANYHKLDGLKFGKSTAKVVEDLKLYIEFVDRDLMFLPTLFDGVSRQNVRFSDLWCLFKPGDYVYWPQASTPGVSNHHSVWRVYGVSSSSIDDDDPDDIMVATKANSFTIYIYAIGYDGQKYGMVARNFELFQWAGEKEIRSLELFPVRYCNNPNKFLSDQKEYGKRFHDCIEKRHFYYEGRAKVHNPARAKDDTDGLTHHVESEVIVDFAEILQSNPSWKPNYDFPKLSPGSHPIGHDSTDIRVWTPYSGLEKVKGRERILRNDGVVNCEQAEYVKSNPFLSSIRNEKDPQITEEDYILLPRNLFAYILRERKCAIIDIESVKDAYVPEENPFNDLNLKPGYKELIQSLVRSHFQRNKIPKSSPISRMNQDLILGKGSGLIILLHGVPGVGKTATAEAVAQSNRKPLFAITCGDLGFTPREVESNLTEIFRLAALWDCILLLDEADIFLSRREKSDLKRNALVSVFLRVLEYYRGILFLTTNKVGHLDEAFKSRIHLSLYYEPLNKEQTMEIFKMNIARLTKIEKERLSLQESSDDDLPKLFIEEMRILNFASYHFDNSDDVERWNGRQIRNAFQVASSLAHYEYQEGETESSRLSSKLKDIGPVLDDTHFKHVAEVTRMFSQYISAAMNSTDRDFAQSGGYRADDWRYDQHQSPWSGYQGPVHNRPRRGGRYNQRLPPPTRTYSGEVDEYDYDRDDSYENTRPAGRPSRSSYSRGQNDRSDDRKRRDEIPLEDEYPRDQIFRPSNKGGAARW